MFLVVRIKKGEATVASLESAPDIVAALGRCRRYQEDFTAVFRTSDRVLLACTVECRRQLAIARHHLGLAPPPQDSEDEASPRRRGRGRPREDLAL